MKAESNGGTAFVTLGKVTSPYPQLDIGTPVPLSLGSLLRCRSF